LLALRKCEELEGEGVLVEEPLPVWLRACMPRFEREGSREGEYFWQAGSEEIFGMEGAWRSWNIVVDGEEAMGEEAAFSEAPRRRGMLERGAIEGRPEGRPFCLGCPPPVPSPTPDMTDVPTLTLSKLNLVDGADIPTTLSPPSPLWIVDLLLDRLMFPSGTPPPKKYRFGSGYCGLGRVDLDELDVV
jgi:hypothetical protein